MGSQKDPRRYPPKVSREFYELTSGKVWKAFPQREVGDKGRRGWQRKMENARRQHAWKFDKKHAGAKAPLHAATPRTGACLFETQ